MILFFDLTTGQLGQFVLMRHQWTRAQAQRLAVGHHLTRAGELQREALDCWTDMGPPPRCAILMALSAWHLEQAFNLSKEHWRD